MSSCVNVPIGKFGHRKLAEFGQNLIKQQYELKQASIYEWNPNAIDTW